MLRPTSDVTDAVAPKQTLKLSLSAPRRVLRAVVGQNLLGRPEGRDAALEGFQHELRALMVRRRVRNDKTRVVVHEDRQVHPLVASEQKRENVRLPKLIRCRPLESTHRMLSGLSGPRRRLEQPFLMQNATHVRLAHAERRKARQHVSDATRSVIRMLLPQPHDGSSLLASSGARHPTWRRPCWSWNQRVNAADLVRVEPVVDRRPTDPGRACDMPGAHPSTQHLFHDAQPYADGISPPFAEPRAPKLHCRARPASSLLPPAHLVLHPTARCQGEKGRRC